MCYNRYRDINKTKRAAEPTTESIPRPETNIRQKGIKWTRVGTHNQKQTV